MQDKEKIDRILPKLRKREITIILTPRTCFPAIIVRYVKMSNTNASFVHNGNMPRNCIGKGRCFVTQNIHP